MIQSYKVRAFTSEGDLGGNPAGIVLDANSLDKVTRQAIAKKLNYSETAFHSIHPGSQLDELEFYTPIKQIELCGHATVGTFGLLSQQRPDGEYPVRIGNGVFKVMIQKGRIGLQQHLHSVEPLDEKINTEVKSSLMGVAQSIFGTMSVVFNGVRFFVIEVDTLENLNQLVPDQTAIEKISHEYDLIGYYLYSQSEEKSGQAFSRMFAPAYGIPEEAATGMGAGCLMGHLNYFKGTTHLKVTQGLGMEPPCPSDIELTLNQNDIWVYGKFALEGKLQIEIPH